MGLDNSDQSGVAKVFEFKRSPSYLNTCQSASTVLSSETAELSRNSSGRSELSRHTCTCIRKRLIKQARGKPDSIQPRQFPTARFGISKSFRPRVAGNSMSRTISNRPNYPP